MLLLWSVFANCYANEVLYPVLSNATLPVADFTGRQSALIEVKNKLKSKGIAVLTGITGIGKTQIARKYAQDNKYKIIWFFDCQKNPNEQYQWLAKAINQSICKDKKSCYVEEDQKYVIESVNIFLEQEKLTWLLVYDNYEASNKTSWHAYFPQIDVNLNHHILGTSQVIVPWGDKINVLPFTSSESLEFLAKNLSNQLNHDSIEQLANNCGDYPILLANIAYYMRENPYVTVNELLALEKSQNRLYQEVQLKNFLRDILIPKIKESPEAYRLLLRCILLGIFQHWDKKYHRKLPYVAN